MTYKTSFMVIYEQMLYLPLSEQVFVIHFVPFITAIFQSQDKNIRINPITYLSM